MGPILISKTKKKIEKKLIQKIGFVGNANINEVMTKYENPISMENISETDLNIPREEKNIQKKTEIVLKKTRFEAASDRIVKMQRYKEDVNIENLDHDTHAESNSAGEVTEKKKNLQNPTQNSSSHEDVLVGNM